jgi:hypothetical protein
VGFGGFAIPFVRGRDLPVAEIEVGQIAGMVTAKLDASLVTAEWVIFLRTSILSSRDH